VLTLIKYTANHDIEIQHCTTLDFAVNIWIRRIHVAGFAVLISGPYIVGLVSRLQSLLEASESIAEFVEMRPMDIVSGRI
jgi:hypothetical protein